METLAHEIALISAFIIRERRQRMIEMLQNPKRRIKLLQRLAHFGDLDSRFAHRIPSNQQSAISIGELLKQKGALETCHIISENTDIDGKDLPLLDVLLEIVGHGMGTLLSCIPGKLGYYEGESPGERYVLERVNV